MLYFVMLSTSWNVNWLLTKAMPKGAVLSLLLHRSQLEHCRLIRMLVLQVHTGNVVLSPAATLTWLGFADEGLLAAYDSEV